MSQAGSIEVTFFHWPLNEKRRPRQYPSTKAGTKHTHHVYFYSITSCLYEANTIVTMPEEPAASTVGKLFSISRTSPAFLMSSTMVVCFRQGASVFWGISQL